MAMYIKCLNKQKQKYICAVLIENNICFSFKNDLKLHIESNEFINNVDLMLKIEANSCTIYGN